MSTNAEGISIRAYAKLQGCSHVAVKKAIDSGKIVAGYVNGKIIPEIADQEWAAAAGGSVQNTKLRENLGKSSPAPGAPADAAEGRMSLQEAVRREKAARARIEELKLQEMEGTLVQRELVYNGMFEVGKEIKETFQALPDRIIDDIRAADTRNEAYTILVEAIAQGLEAVANMKLKGLD